MISSDLPEVIGMSDRVYVMSEGRVTGELDRSELSEETIMKYAVRPAYFVPETIKADVLFRNMNQTGNTIAVVMDEHGGMVGIITLYDLIEELVGELNDGSEDAENRDPYLEKIDDKTWKVVGNIDLSDIEDELGIEIETDDIDTFTGLVFDVFGVIPDDGPQNIDLEIQNMIIHVSYIDDHQIQEATIQLKPEEEAAEEKEK